MADENKNNFSFDNDPGKMDNVDDVDFTFSDIPVLGVEKEQKDAFSFDQLPKEEDASIASFEALLKELPKADDQAEGFDVQTRTAMDIGRVKLDRKAKAKKKLLKKLIIAGAVVAVFLVIAGVTYFIVENIKVKAKEEAAKLTPAQQQALKIKQLEEEITALINVANKQLTSKKNSDALETYKSVLKLDATNPLAFSGIAKCYEFLSEEDKAIDFYKKAIKDKRSDVIPFANLATILIRQKKLNLAIQSLEKGVKKFPKEKKLLIPLANAYYSEGMESKSLDTYKKIPKASLLKKPLKTYAKLLKSESKTDAKKLFVYIADKFKDFDSYCEAVTMSKSNDDKIQIFSDAVKKLKESTDADNAKFMLASSLMGRNKDKDKSDALELVNGIIIKNLSAKNCEKILKLATNVGVENINIFSIKLLNSHPNNLQLLQAIQQQLLKSLGAKAVLDIFGEWCNKNKNKAIPNFLYAKAFGTSLFGKKYYLKAISIDPKLYEANMELGKIAMNEKKWDEAEIAFKKCFKSPKYNNKARYLYTFARFTNGKGVDAIDEYRKFLNSEKLTESQIAVKLIPLALLLPTSTLADKYLSIIKRNSKLKKEYKEFFAKRELFFGGNNPEAFSGKKEGKFREYCILDMLAKGKSREVLLMPTPPAEFPEFWKIFIARNKGIKFWKKGAELLLKKNQTSTDITLKIILNLWLEKITLPEAEKKLARIPLEKEALFYLIIAEEYKRKGMKTKAKIRYRKALKLNHNIYSGVVKFYSKQK